MKLFSGLLALLLLASAAQSALAGDFAETEILGFSPDGGIFAFEEYGVQDGSGFPYSNIYFIETATDSWLEGTPFRVRIDSETAKLSAAREQARARAQLMLNENEIAPRGRSVAANPVTELSADPHQVTFNPRLVVPPIDEAHRLVLKETPMPAEPICKDFGQTRGYSLELQAPGTNRVLHEDERIPSSRKCPLKYAIAEVITYYPGNAPVLAVLILMKQVGFEGPDGRYLAVTARLN